MYKNKIIRKDVEDFYMDIFKILEKFKDLNKWSCVCVCVYIMYNVYGLERLLLCSFF